MPPMRILISGAGVAGNALAFWLSRLGHNVTVIERSPALRTSGLQVDLRGHGVEVLRRMGLEDAFLAKKAPEQGVEVVDKHGRRQGFFPSNALSPSPGTKPQPQNFTSDYEIMRGDLCQLLHDAALRSNATFLFNKSITAFTSTLSHVTVTLSDSTTSTYDLLIGADGQRSSTRRHLFGPSIEAEAYRPFHQTYLAYFTIPRPVQPHEEYIGSIYIAPVRRGIMTRRHSPTHIQVYIGCNSSDPRFESRNLDERKEAWEERFRDAGWKAKEVIDAMKQRGEEDIYFETPALVTLDRWFDGRAVLTGDAAWCPTPTTGVGTTCAMVGAYVLAGEIAKGCGDGGEEEVERALRGYEEKFGPYMKEIQKGVSVENGGESLMGRVMATEWGIWGLHWAVRLAAGMRMNLGRWFLKEDVLEGWDLEEYKGVEGMLVPGSTL
ncbi:hypothetical protein QBC34DRAFT_455424 [Podospora aff. communis PSN243]|uniref:FAD-binding domain-containing protein n=1 Tax=Podospora aff. communis PSN243 TaxID=3040156 RepID=A0AAV9GWA2_9PEZI|nr:hypothetical protein QBC34DRAFT_455424 [Podospora aff. communis PSN243]